MTDIQTPEQPSVRKAGLRGLRKESHAPSLMLTNFAPEPAIDPDVDIDVSQGFEDVGMDYNDNLGCCGAAMVDHGFMIQGDSMSLYDQLGRPKYEGTRGTYWAYGISQGESGPEPDQGVDNASWFKFLFDEGIIEVYAEVPKSQWRQAMANFYGICIGAKLGDDSQPDFEATPPIPWGSNEQADPPDPQEGHDIYGVKSFGSASTVGTPNTAVVLTWGKQQVVTHDWIEENATDIWVFGSKELFARNGVDHDALIEQIKNWSGEVAEPTPAPAPIEPPAPSPQLHEPEKAEEIVEEIVEDIKEVVKNVETWYRNGGDIKNAPVRD